MILKALYDYYNRDADNMPPMNREYAAFYYAIVIDEYGHFIELERLGKENGLSLLILREEERTSAPLPHCMGDNGSYVLGLKDIKNPEECDYRKELDNNRKNHNAFKNNIKRIYERLPNNKYAKAISAFYSSYGLDVINQMKQDVHWTDLCKVLNKNITFRIKGDTCYAACDKEIISFAEQQRINENENAICLITGNKARPVTTTHSTFVAGGKSNAKLVAFQISSGYDSYGKDKGLNAPISEEAEFKYTTALQKLLSDGSHNKFRVGNRTFLFWSSLNNEASKKTEESVFSLFGNMDEEDDPNARIESVRKVFMAIHSGQLETSPEDRFYILGLAPNAARIAVVYWAESSQREFAGKILKHFDDMTLMDTRKERKPYFGLRNILSAVTLGGKPSDATPNLPERVIQSIFQGSPYPFTLYSSCLRRIRAESGSPDHPSVTITRAAIIKAYINRSNNYDNNQKLNIMIDKKNTNQGYLCGRLFAVLDKIQEDANRISSIRERYINAASVTPSTVFATILNLSTHHIGKLKKESSQIFYEKLKQEIISKMPSEGFPTHLNTQDQGRFFVGYYHQRQELFTVKNDNQ